MSPDVSEQEKLQKAASQMRSYTFQDGRGAYLNSC